MDGELRNIREELDEHLDALNQNTNEIATLHEYVSELDLRLEKVTERLDALQALMLAQTPTVKSVRLTSKEESIVQILVNSTEPLASVAIAKLVGFTPDMAAQTLYALKQKGVPVQSQTLGEQTFYAIDAAFRELQRGRIVIDER